MTLDSGLPPRTERIRVVDRPMRVSGMTLIGLAIVLPILGLLPAHHQTLYVAILFIVSVIAFFTGLLALYQPLDLTEPIHWLNLVSLIIFALHPVFVIHSGLLTQPYHNNFSIGPFYLPALYMSLIGVIGYNLGYIFGFRKREARAGTGAEVRPETLLRVAKVTTVIGLLGGLSNAAAGGGIASFIGKSSNSTSSAYVYMAVLALIPASVAWLAAGRLMQRPSYTVFGASLATSLAALALVGGLRTALMGMVLPPAIFWVLVNRKRVSRIWLPIAILLAIVGFSLLRDVNNQEVGFSGSLKEFTAHPVEVVTGSLSGSDTEMVDALSIELGVVPSLIPHRPGLMVTSTLGAVIPRKYWPDKPATADLVLNGHFFNAGVNDASVAYSILGEAYLDSGLLGVALLSFLVGLGFKYLAALSTSGRQQVTWPMLLYCFCAPLGVTLIRGILAYTLAYALFYVGPILLGWRSDARARTRPAASDGLT